MFDHYPQYQEWYARVQLICFMVGMGVNLTLGDFLLVAKRPRSFLLGFVGQVCVIPLIAVAINWLFGLEPRFALGMILVAAMPGGTMSKVFVYLGRGHIPLSITLTAVSTLATLVTVPVTLELLAADLVPDDVAMPVGVIVADVLLFLIAPLALGMMIGKLWPARRRLIATWSVRVGFVIVAAMIAGSLGSGLIQPGEHGLRLPLAIILFCLLGQQLNMVPFYLFPLPRADRLAVGIEVTMRNMNLALLLNASLFKANADLNGGVMFVILFYAAVALAAGIPLALNHRRLWRRDHAAVHVSESPKTSEA
jgi:BASS family bile acid:Na+ symporter